MKTLWAIWPMLTFDERPFCAEDRQEQRDEDVGVDAVEQHLEDAVEGDQAGGSIPCRPWPTRSRR